MSDVIDFDLSPSTSKARLSEVHRYAVDNALARAFYRMNVVENRLFKFAVSRLDSRSATSGQLSPVRVTAKEFGDAFRMDPTNVYEQLRNASYRLLGRPIRVPALIDYPETLYVMIVQVTYYAGQGCVDLYFNPPLAPFLLGLRERFTTFVMDSGFSRLTTFASQRLYEVLKSVDSLPEYHVSLSTLRLMLLRDPNRYKRWNLFSSRVLFPAIDAINDHTDMLVRYHLVRKSRSISGVVFTHSEHAQLPF